MANPWVEGGYYEEWSRKCGWNNKEREKQKKSDSRKVERKAKKIYLKMWKYKKEKKRFTYIKDERRENSKVKKYKKN